MSIADDNAPKVIGQEEEDRLIRMDCPHCGIEEFRIMAGLNWCEATGKSFLLVAMEWEEKEE